MSDGDATIPPLPAEDADVHAEVLRRKAEALTPKERRDLLELIEASLAKLDEKSVDRVD